MPELVLNRKSLYREPGAQTRITTVTFPAQAQSTSDGQRESSSRDRNWILSACEFSKLTATLPSYGSIKVVPRVIGVAVGKLEERNGVSVVGVGVADTLHPTMNKRIGPIRITNCKNLWWFIKVSICQDKLITIKA